MSWLRSLVKGELPIGKREELRRSANVIADSVMAARDREIVEAAKSLDDARAQAREKRLEVARSASAARSLKAAMEAAGERFEVGIGQVARRLTTGND